MAKSRLKNLLSRSTAAVVGVTTACAALTGVASANSNYSKNDRVWYSSDNRDYGGRGGNNDRDKKCDWDWSRWNSDWNRNNSNRSSNDRDRNKDCDHNNYGGRGGNDYKDNKDNKDKDNKDKNDYGGRGGDGHFASYDRENGGRGGNDYKHDNGGRGGNDYDRNKGGRGGSDWDRDNGGRGGSDRRFSNESNTDVRNNTDVSIDNNVRQDATSGDVDVRNNDDVDGQVTSGDASNESFNDFSVDVENSSDTSNNGGRGGNNWNNNSGRDRRFSNESNTDVRNNTDVSIDNNVRQDATSGDVDVRNNDDVDGKITSGDATNINENTFDVTTSNRNN
jgi:hypothetical protein